MNLSLIHVGGAVLDLSQGVALLTIATAIFTFATIVGFGLQRGRIKGLEDTADKLRKDLSDETNRRKVTLDELTEVRVKAGAYHDELVVLRAKVGYLDAALNGVEGPLAEVLAMLGDVLQLLGDKRTRPRARKDPNAPAG